MPDENFDDEHTTNSAGAPPADGGPPADGRRQHKYSTKDMKPERPWKRWCLTICTCLVCIAIMIAISILMQKLFNPPEDEDWSDDVVNATDDLFGTPGALSGEAKRLPKNMDFIEDVCSETRLGEDDVAACENACAPAQECCNPYAGGGNSTCFEEEQAGCFAYAKCHSLNGFFDPAHNDLDRVCNKASLEKDPNECINACSSLSCCYKTEESCVSKNFEACLDYVACQNLKEYSIDAAPVDLDERCEKETPTCNRACREAFCCSDPHTPCYRDNFLTCLSYSSCTGNSEVSITVAPIYSRVDPAPPILEDDCTIAGIANYGVEKCLDHCAPAQCCWEDGAGGCFGDDPLGCMEYQRCTILKTPDYAGYTYPPISAAPRTPAPTPAAATPEPTPASNVTTTSAPTEAPTGNETTTSPAPTAGATQSAGRRIRG